MVPSTEPDDTDDRKLLRQNLAELLSALRAQHLRRVEVRYTLARGRCRHCALTTMPSEARLTMSVPFHRQAADAGQPERQHFTETVSLQEALQRFGLHWLSVVFGHWRTDHGGEGVMRIEVEAGQLTLEYDALLVENYRTTLRE
jgi:hypothetical protein